MGFVLHHPLRHSPQRFEDEVVRRNPGFRYLHYVGLGFWAGMCRSSPAKLDALVARLEHVQARRESQKPIPYFVDAQFDHSVTMIRAEQDWVEQFIRRLERRENTVLRQPMREV